MTLGASVTTSTEEGPGTSLEVAVSSRTLLAILLSKTKNLQAELQGARSNMSSLTAADDCKLKATDVNEYQFCEQ